MRHVLLLFALLIVTTTCAQFPVEHRYDKQQVAERKKNKVRAAYFTEQYTATGKRSARVTITYTHY